MIYPLIVTSTDTLRGITHPVKLSPYMEKTNTMRAIFCHVLFVELKANSHAAICRPDLSVTIGREANRFMYSASTAHALFRLKTFFKKRFGKQMVGDG